MALRLHVIYAGRGDAFVLQDGDELWVIDGGPLGATPQSRGGAPYFRHLTATLANVAAQLGQPEGTAILNGVVLSHAHDDHYGGIFELLSKYVSRTYAVAPTQERPVVFNGPLVTQPLNDLTQAGQRDLETVVDTFHYAKWPSPEPVDLGPFRFGDPATCLRAVYKRPQPPRPEPGKIWTVDDSAENLASVLMLHRAGRMLFTGDSTGNKILDFRGQVVGQENEPLWIFKVPHHGSLRNSRRTVDMARVPAQARHEYALLCLTLESEEWGRWQVPLPLREPGAMGVARSELEEICRARRVSYKTLAEQLETAVGTNFQAAAAGAAINWQYAATDTRSLWKPLSDALEARAIIAAPDPRLARSRKRRCDEMQGDVSRSWYDKFQAPSLLSEPYLAERAFAELKAFYGGFAAYNYVISADGSHGHPAAETIAAIAASRTALVPTARVFVTDAASIDLERIATLAGPAWREKIDLRALCHGSAITLDLSNPANAVPPVPATQAPGTAIAIDPDKTTTSVAAMAEPDRTQLRTQLQQGHGPRIPPRPVDRELFRVQIPGANPLYLGLNADDEPLVTVNPTSFTVEEAWLLQPPQPQVTIVRLEGSVGQRLFQLINRGDDRWALRLHPADEYVSTDPARSYRTPNLDDPNLAVFEFVRVTPAPERGRLAGTLARLGGLVRRLRLRATPATEPTLRAFLEAAGLPSGVPLSGREALAALVGPAAAAKIVAETKLRVLGRIFGWEADLDKSTVTWTSDAEGLLVEAARVSVKVGSPATFTIEGTTETIVSTWLALERAEQLAVTAGLKTAEATELDHTATIAAPGRGRPLAEYLGAVGVAGAEQGEVTVAGLLSRMLGSQSLVERLLMNGPSFIAAAGIGIAKLDVETSEVETFASPTGGLDVLSAHLVTRQASISASVGGVALTLEDLAFTVEGAMLPGASLALTAAAKITPAGTGSQPVLMRAETVLSEDRPELVLTLAEDATLRDAIALLPGAPALGNLEVPVAGQTLGAVSLSSLGISLRQPVEDADAYIVASVFGAIEFTNWGSILPAGFPAVTRGKVSVRVFEPEDPVRRRVGFEGEVAFALASGRTLAAAARAWPMAGSGETGTVDRSLAKSVTVWADPEAGPVTLPEVVTAFGLPSIDAIPAPLAELLRSVALEEIAIELKDANGGAEVASFELALAIARVWEPLTGFSLTAGWLDLRYDGSEWSGEVTATMLLGGTIAIEAGYVAPTATTAGAFTFAPVGLLNLKEAAEKIGLGALTEVPLLGSVLETVSVTEVALALAAGTTSVPTVTSRSLGLLLDTIKVGPLTVEGVALNLTRTVPASETERAQTSLWVEAELGGKAILEVAWDSAKGRLAGSLRMLEPQTLNQMLATLLGSNGPANVLLPIVGEFAVIGAEVEFDTADEKLKAFRLDLDTSKALTLGPATISTLGIVYEAGAEGEKPATYALTGKLRGQNLRATIEVGCQAETGSATVNASVKSAGAGFEALTLEGLVSMLGLTDPTAPPLQGAPNFLSLEVSEVSVKLSYASELSLQALKAKVQSTAAITLVATTPPLELEQLSLEVTYEKAASQALTGTIFGKLTVPSTPAVTVELEYSVDKKGVGVFEGDLSLTENPPGFETLLAQGPFDPGAGGGLPANIGLPSAIPMAELTVRVEMPSSPQPASVTVSGYARPTKWEWEALGIGFAVKELGGAVEVTAPAAQGGALQYDCSLFGVLFFGRFEGSATLAFGAGRNTVLTAITTEAQAVALPEVAGMLSGGGETAWTEVVPANTAPLGFSQGSEGYAYFDLTAGSFALLGSLAGFGAGALVSHPGTTRSFAFLASLSSSFRFANLWSELQAVDQYVAVRSANLALIDYSGGVVELKADIAAVEKVAAAEGISLEVPFAGLDWLGEGGVGPTQLTKGGAFFADLALSTEGTLSRNLESIVDEPAEAAAITLYALVDHSEPKNTVYSGTITDLTLLGGGLVLAGTLTYRPGAEATQLEASGSLTLKLDAAEDGYEFEGKLTLGTEKATFAAATTGAPIEIEDPFGGMFGISIAKAQLAAEFDFGGKGAASTIVVSGEVSFKVVVRLPQMTAAIVFLSGKPALAKVELPGAVSVDKLLQGIGLPWPSGYEVLTLENGSVYYAPERVSVGGVQYEQGYHMATTAKVLGHAIGIDVEVASDGIVAQAVVEAGLDFYFLQLTGYEESGQKHKGPFVRISTRSPTSFTVGAGVSLFHAPLGSTTLTYRPSPLSEWAGSVTAASTVPVLGGTTVGFSYSEANGFQLTNMGLLSDAIKWAHLANQLIEASSGSTICGRLVDLAWDDVVTTHAKVKFTQSGESSESGLPFALTGAFDVFVAGEKVTSVPLPTLKGVIPKPKEFKLEELPSWLVATLTENLFLMAKSLFEHQAELVAFVGALTTLTAAKAGLAALICNGVETRNVAIETEAAVNTGLKEVVAGAAEVADAVGTALVIDEAAKAAAATIAAAGLLAGLDVLVTELVDLIEKAKHWLPELADKQAQAERERTTAKERLDEANARMEKLLAMAGAPTAAFAPGSSSATQVLVSWTPDDRPNEPGFEYESYKDVIYLAQVSTTQDFSSGVVSAEEPGGESRIGVELPALASVNYAYARIRAVYQYEGKEWKGPWKEAAAPAFHVVPLPAPASVTQTLSPDGDTITVTVAPVAEATGYTVTLLDPTKPTTILLHQQVPAPSSGPAVASLDTRRLPDSVATGASLVAVAVAEGDPAVHTTSPSTSSTPLSTSAPPSMPTVAVEANGLHVTWPTPQATPRPELRVEVGGALLSPQPQLISWDADDKGCLLGAEGIGAGETAGVEMRLPDPTYVALWSSPAATVPVPMVAPPGRFAALFDCVTGELVLSWDGDAEASSWEVECRAAGGGALSPPPTITPGPTGATVSGPAIAAGSAYEVRARGLKAGSVSLWSEWTPVTAAAVGGPTGVSLSLADDALKATWSTCSPAGAFRVQLLILPAKVVVGEASPTVAEASFDLKAPLAPEVECEVAVRVLVGASLGVAGTSKATTPTLLGLIEAIHGAAVDATEAARAYQPTLGYAELLVTLVAAGYPVAEAETATLAEFPGSPLAPLVAALNAPARLAPLLTGATPPVPVPVVVRLTARLFSGKPVELAIQLRLGGLAQGGVAAALPSAYPSLDPQAAIGIAAAAYVEPWALGAQLFAGSVAEAQVVPDLLDAYPALPALRAMASLNASYEVGRDSKPVGAALAAEYGEEEWGVALGALLVRNGEALAQRLQAESVSRQEATSYLAATFPRLSSEAVNRAIEAAYGPSG